MKRIFVLLTAAVLLLVSLGGCAQGLQKYNRLTPTDGVVTIDAAQVGRQALFFNYDADGVTAGGCNPWPIQSLEQNGDVLTMAVEELDAMKAAFARWGGPVR